MTVEQIDARIAELKKELETLLANANRAVGELSGRIAELEKIKSEMK